MISWTSTNIILAIIGMIGLFSTATVVTYGFKRNRTGKGNYQQIVHRGSQQSLSIALSYKHIVKLIKQLALGVAGLFLSVTPSLATVDPYTDDLLELMDDNGVTVVVDNAECDGSFQGAYQFAGMRRRMVICTYGTVDAADHNTVRHETVHALQHCVNSLRGNPLNTPVIQDTDDLLTFAREHLTEEQLQWIVSNYPKEHWLVEIEAFAGANAYTSYELMEMFETVCIAEA